MLKELVLSVGLKSRELLAAVMAAVSMWAPNGMGQKSLLSYDDALISADDNDRVMCCNSSWGVPGQLVFVSWDATDDNKSEKSTQDTGFNGIGCRDGLTLNMIKDRDFRC
jgi:hypothetical protein